MLKDWYSRFGVAPVSVPWQIPGLPEAAFLPRNLG